MNQRLLSSLVSVAIGGAMLASAALAQQFVYPAKGQSPEQQKKDEAACTQWAKGQAATAPAAGAPAPATTATGTTPGAGVRGAARGALVGEIVGGDAGAGAAAGAIAARSQSRRQNAAQQQQAQASQQGNVAKARAACLEGRGYTVK